jgi:hypothetical protein
MVADSFFFIKSGLLPPQLIPLAASRVQPGAGVLEIMRLATFNPAAQIPTLEKRPGGVVNKIACNKTIVSFDEITFLIFAPENWRGICWI